MLTPYACTYVVTAEGYRALSHRFIAGKSADSFCYFTPTYVVTFIYVHLRFDISLAPHTPTYVVTEAMTMTYLHINLAPHTPTYVVTRFISYIECKEYLAPHTPTYVVTAIY